MDSWVDVALSRVFFITCATALTTRELISSTSAEHFLALMNYMWFAPPPWAVDQVDFVDLDCSLMTLQELI